MDKQDSTNLEKIGPEGGCFSVIDRNASALDCQDALQHRLKKTQALLNVAFSEDSFGGLGREDMASYLLVLQDLNAEALAITRLMDSKRMAEGMALEFS